MEKMKTISVNIVVIILLALMLIWGNTFFRQWTQLGKGDKALAAGDVIDAISGYEAAIHMYTPFSPLVERAAANLWNVGEDLRNKGDRERALIAYRALRSSYYAIRGLNHPGTTWIEKSDLRIAELVKQQLSPSP